MDPRWNRSKGQVSESEGQTREADYVMGKKLRKWELQLSALIAHISLSLPGEEYCNMAMTLEAHIISWGKGESKIRKG